MHFKYTQLFVQYFVTKCLFCSDEDIIVSTQIKLDTSYIMLVRFGYFKVIAL